MSLKGSNCVGELTGQKLTLRPSFLERKRAYDQCIREVEH